MKRYLSPLAKSLAFWGLALLSLCSQASAQTAGLRTFGLDEFLMETEGFEIVCDDLDSLIDIDGNPAQLQPFPDVTALEPSQSISIGQLSTEATTFNAILPVPTPAQPEIFTILEFSNPLNDPQPLVLELDPSLGQLEGFFVEAGRLRVSLFDGDTLLDNYPVSTSTTTSVIGINQAGWINTQGLNVTRIEFSRATDEDLGPSGGLTRASGLLGNLKAAFTPLPEPPAEEPPAETCFDQLEDVKAEVEALLATATDADAYRLQSVFDCVCWIQNDAFWVQPSGDRLTSYGGNVFLGGAYTIAFLERVSDPQADVIIDQLLDVLACLVDREIEYAIENGGRQANIDKAMDFADLGDIIDDEFENEVVASLAYKLAWLNAFYSTY